MIVDDCVKCARKHTRKAAVCFLEARKGHPEKWDMCLAHLAEAGDALATRDQSLAEYYREEYLKYDADGTYKIDWENLFGQLNILYEKDGVYKQEAL